MQLQSLYSMFGFSKKNLEKQRINGLLEIIPDNPFGNLFQFLNSMTAIASPDLYISEKFIHALETILAATKLGLMISMYQESDASADNCKNLCQYYTLANILYKVSLFLMWGAGELQNSIEEEEAEATTNKKMQ